MQIPDDVLREVEWRDSTSYSRGERGKAEPTSWTADLGSGVKISITCGHIYHQPKWIMHCFALAMDTVPLGFTCGDSLDLVKRAAIIKAITRSNEISAAFARLRKAMEAKDG